MSEQDKTPAKYHVDMNQPQGVVIGDHLNVEQHIYSASPPHPPATRSELLASIFEANAELRNYPDEIAGIHINRPEVDKIVAWICEGDSEERLGMVLDQPGSGKTVVMHDVLLSLESKKVPVLAIKADFL